MKFKSYLFVTALFFLVLAVRLFFVFQTPHMNFGESYLNLRYTESFKDNILFKNDPLSYGGKSNLLFPVFYLLTSLLSLFKGLPMEYIVKIFSNILYSSLVFVIYAIIYNLTKSKVSSLSGALFSSFIPIFFKTTLHEFSVMSLFLPLLFLLFNYLFHFFDTGKFQIKYLFLLLILSFLHPYIVYVLIFFIIYFILLKVENLKLSPSIMEGLLFSSFFVFWIVLLILRPALKMHGPMIIWQNIPSLLLDNYFVNFDLFGMVSNIGIAIVFFGLYMVYKMFDLRDKKHLLLISVLLSTVLLLLLRLIPFSLGQSLIGLIFCIFIGIYIHQLFGYLKKLHVAKYTNLIIGSIIFGIFLSILIPSLFFGARASTQDSIILSQEISAFEWASENIPDGSVILTSYREGDLVTAFAKKKSVLDSNFMLVPDINVVFSDVSTMYKSISLTTSLRLMEKYDVDYVYVSPKLLSYYGLKKILSLDSDECFEKIYDSYAQIYHVKCSMESLLTR